MNKKSKKPTEKKDEPIYGNPEYGPNEDIYSNSKKVAEAGEDETESPNKKGLPGEDLDIPGAELDDVDEEIGEEDEENNYYSLGGDNHENLEESQDD